MKPIHKGYEINYVKRLQNISSKLLGGASPLPPSPLPMGLAKCETMSSIWCRPGDMGGASRTSCHKTVQLILIH